MAEHSRTVSDMHAALGLSGGSLGAAGWILGAAIEIQMAPGLPQATTLDLFVVVLCASGVLLTGAIIWCLYLSGRRLSVVAITNTLLGASIGFGTLAIVWIDVRGLLPQAVRGFGGRGQPGNEIWESLGRHVSPQMVYAVPVLILLVMGFINWPPIGRHLLRGPTHLERGSQATLARED